MSPRNPTPLGGRTAVITGAGPGIGRPRQRLSAHGCPIAIVDANGETLAATAALLDGPTLMRTLDVRDRQRQLALTVDVRERLHIPGRSGSRVRERLNDSVESRLPDFCPG